MINLIQIKQQMTPHSAACFFCLFPRCASVALVLFLCLSSLLWVCPPDTRNLDGNDLTDALFFNTPVSPGGVVE